MSDLFEAGRQALADQPFSALVGAELLAYGQGRVELGLTISDHLHQQSGYVHGGVIAYLADNALTFAAGAVLGPSVLTVEFKINYLRPATGERLIARGSVLSAGKRQAVCRCEIYTVRDGAETICAAAQGTVAAVGEVPPPPR